MMTDPQRGLIGRITAYPLAEEMIAMGHARNSIGPAHKAILQLQVKGIDPRGLSLYELQKLRNVGPKTAEAIREYCDLGHPWIVEIDKRKEQKRRAREYRVAMALSPDVV